MKVVIDLVRITALVWVLVMLTAIERIGIKTEGQVQLQETSRGAYASIAVAVISSFIADSAFNRKHK